MEHFIHCLAKVGKVVGKQAMVKYLIDILLVCHESLPFQ